MPGRKKGSKNKGIYGMRKAQRALEQQRRLIAEGKISAEMDPDAHEAEGVILGVMRGEIGGRYTGFRLQAASTLLERRRGKPVQKTDIGGTLAELIERSMEQKELPAQARHTLLPESIIEADVVEDKDESDGDSRDPEETRETANVRSRSRGERARRSHAETA